MRKNNQSIGSKGSVALSPSSRTNTNDRLPRAPLGRVEGGDGIVEGRDGPDVRPQSSVPQPLDDLTELIQVHARGLPRKDNICRVCHASAAKHVASDPQRSRTVARVAALMALRLCAQPGHRSQVWNALSDSPASCGPGLARDSLGRTRTTRPSATPYLSPNGSRREDGANEAR